VKEGRGRGIDDDVMPNYISLRAGDRLDVVLIRGGEWLFGAKVDRRAISSSFIA